MAVNESRNPMPRILLVDDDAELLAMLREYLAPEGFEVVTAADGEIVARGRAELLRHALENVIRNAVKYTAKDTAVAVAAARGAASGVVTVSVCDRGPGVPEADLDSLFEPFFRAEGGAARAGYGLGLAIARRAVEAHGGRIRARNRSGGGLCVEIQLPFFAEDAQRARRRV